MPRKPRLAVFKFASCDGCQLSLLDCEDELLALAGELEISHFLEASSAVQDGPYDLSLVEGSITTPHDAARIREVRRRSRALVTIGAMLLLRTRNKNKTKTKAKAKDTARIVPAGFGIAGRF